MMSSNSMEKYSSIYASSVCFFSASAFLIFFCSSFGSCFSFSFSSFSNSGATSLQRLPSARSPGGSAFFGTFFRIILWGCPGDRKHCWQRTKSSQTVQSKRFLPGRMALSQESQRNHSSSATSSSGWPAPSWSPCHSSPFHSSPFHSSPFQSSPFHSAPLDSPPCTSSPCNSPASSVCCAFSPRRDFTGFSWSSSVTRTSSGRSLPSTSSSGDNVSSLPS
mmetsp:Transcript_35900/g.86420  ORF Transcript_35900/g.86420 Transcript_35900/m.86420 type:complete len:220 (-) Transcript_35900:1170-1829(-)